MDLSSPVPEAFVRERGASQPHRSGLALFWKGASQLVYALALALSVSTWFLAIHAPLWLDETGSYWSIDKGFWQIPFRQDGLSFPAYSYILWSWTRLFGTGEVAMRLLSVVAMLGAAYLLYLAARELFERDVALIAAVVFCLQPIVIFAAIDIRPYALAVLAASAAILLVLRLRRSNSYGLAALFGVVAAAILWFHYLFAVILPALMLCYFALKRGDGKRKWRQFGVGLAAFAVASLPVVPGVLSMFHTSTTHIYTIAPGWLDLLWVLTPGQGFLLLALGMVFAVLIVTATRPRQDPQPIDSVSTGGVVLASLALIPLLTLFSVSRWTPLHMFIPPEHCLVAVPGIALCWSYAAKWLRFRWLRLIFCMILVFVTACPRFLSPTSGNHRGSWKHALDVVESNARADDAPVLVCSEFVESNYAAMPQGSAKESRFFAQLSYYPLSVPVIPLPMGLNAQAKRIGTSFLRTAARKRERFLAMGYKVSSPTLDWLAERAAGNYTVRKLGTFDDVEVLEFSPRGEIAAHSGLTEGRR